MSNIAEQIKHVIDIIAGAIAIGSLMKILPAIASAMTIIWLGIRIHIAIRDELFLKKDKNGNE